MATYLNTKTGEYPRHDGDLELLGWEIGAKLPADWVEVITTPTPQVGESEVVIALDPIKTDEGYFTAWSTRPLTTQEIAFNAKTIVRNKVLAGLALTAEEAKLLVG